MGMLFDPEGLNASFERQAANKAPGVDGMRKADYAEGLSIRLADLSIRLRRLGYRPKPARRVFIPKANGGQRALGVPSFEHLMRFLAHRINDPIFLRIIQRFLKAGVMEDGIVTTSEHGTPQGGLVSPVLANIISITCWTSGLKSASQNRVRVPPIWCGMLMILWYAFGTKRMPGDSWKNSRKGWYISIWKWSPPKR